MEKGTVVNRLIGWARWKLASGNSLGFPKSASFTHLIVDNSRTAKGSDEVDAWCIDTDCAVLSLNDSDRQLIVVEYVSNVREMRLKLELMQMSRSKYYRQLDRSYREIGEYLENKFKNHAVL